jgi:hypothetical protein
MTAANSQRLWGAMDTEIDYDLTPDQWETLKALRVPASGVSNLNSFVLAQLIALRLAAMSDNLPVITPTGRRTLIRGSSRLWDVAA